MYDHLDDPAPPSVGDQTRVAVAARATRLRRKRLAVLLSTGSAMLVGVVVVATAFAESAGRVSLTVVSPTVTATASPSGAAIHPPSPAPTTVVSSPSSGTAGATPAVTTRACFPQDCPDSLAGWASGYASCAPATVAADGDGEPPADGMKLTLTLAASAASGDAVHGTVTITNNSAVTVSFFVQHPGQGLEAGVQGPGGRSSMHSSNAVGHGGVRLAPGESYGFDVVAHTASCGDTSRDPEPALPPGTYQVGVTLDYSGAKQVGDSSPSPSAGSTVRSHGHWSVAQALHVR